MPAPAAIESTLFLIGDAGNPRAEGEPVLQALARRAGERPQRTTILFLGDNVYPRGIPDWRDKGRREAERRLAAQLDVVRETGARGIFIPGNHDWAKHGSSGWDAIRRQGRLVDAAGNGAAMLPRDGCPGPAVVDVGLRVRLVLLDTQWWLQRQPKPGPGTAESHCVPDTETGVADSLRGAIGAGGNRAVIVAGHHPLASGSEHGGYFPWEDYIFPLRQVVPWLWVPLPIGPLYVFARQHGVSAQDFSGKPNRRMRSALEAAFAPRPPLVYASGHDHTLQVFAGPPAPARYVLVSGTGILNHSSAVTWRKNTRFASSEAGFMRLDVLRDGRVRLGVIEVDDRGNDVERYSQWLE